MLNRDKVIARWRKMPPVVAEAAKAELEAQVEQIVEAIRRAAPVGVTGKLRESIRAVPGDRPLTFKIVAGGYLTRKKIRAGVKESDFAKARVAGNNKGEFDYVRAIEFGHVGPDGKFVPADPFFFSTYRAWRPKLIRAVRASVRKRLKAEFPQESST